MRFLCVCNGGNCRSVAIAEMLKGTYGHEAISSGTFWLSRSTMKMLCDWADVIVPVEARDVDWLPPEDAKRWRLCIIWEPEFDAKRRVFAPIFKDIDMREPGELKAFVMAHIKGIL